MDKYEKVRVLGKGSFGSAILIKRKDNDELFVVKEIPLGKMSKQEREDARKECTVLQQLQHPNIVRYIEQFENHNHLYIVMEYCNDSDLGEKVKKCQGSMKESTILYYFSQVCLAMEYLHSKHILHRDIKTMNVFLMKNGAVKLGDFGIATVLQNTMAVAKTVCGTPYYFSPELCRNKPYNNKSDMWSLGILLYECATGGRHPFDGNNLSQLMHRIVKTPHAPLSTSYSLEFRNLVDWCLQKDPSRRPSIRQTLNYPLVRRSLEQLEENLLLATQCKVRLKDLIEYDAAISNAVDQKKRDDGEQEGAYSEHNSAERAGVTASGPPSLRPGQAAAVALSRAGQNNNNNNLVKQQEQSPSPRREIDGEEFRGAGGVRSSQEPPPPLAIGKSSPSGYSSARSNNINNNNNVNHYQNHNGVGSSRGSSPQTSPERNSAQRSNAKSDPASGSSPTDGMGVVGVGKLPQPASQPHNPEDLHKIVSSVSQAQKIRRRITRGDVNAKKNNNNNNIVVNNNNINISNQLKRMNGQLKPMYYRSPYAQQAMNNNNNNRDPARGIPRLGALGGGAGGPSPYMYNPTGRFVRGRLEEESRPQGASRVNNNNNNGGADPSPSDPAESSSGVGVKLKQRSPQPTTRGTPSAYPRKWNSPSLANHNNSNVPNTIHTNKSYSRPPPPPDPTHSTPTTTTTTSTAGGGGGLSKEDTELDTSASSSISFSHNNLHSNVMWHAPPPRSFVLGNYNSPPSGPRTSVRGAEPAAAGVDTDYKRLNYNRMRQRLSPIIPVQQHQTKRASTAGDYSTPPRTALQRVGHDQHLGGGAKSRPQHPSSHLPGGANGNITVEELLESTYEQGMIVSPEISGRSRSEGGYESKPSPAELQLLETYSTFETVGHLSKGSEPPHQSHASDAIRIEMVPVPAPPATITGAEECRVSPTKTGNNGSDTFSEGETAEEEEHEFQEGVRRGSSNRDQGNSVGSKDSWTTSENDAELVDVNFEIEDQRITCLDPFQQNPSNTPRDKINLNCLPTVDYGNRIADVQPVHLPVKGDHHSNNLHRHLYNTEAALYAGMSREAPTLDEELYLEGQKRRSAAETSDTVLPSVLETLRSHREDTVKPSSPLALLRKRQSLSVEQHRGAPRPRPSVNKQQQRGGAGAGTGGAGRRSISASSMSLELVSVHAPAVLPLSLNQVVNSSSSLPSNNSTGVQNLTATNSSVQLNSPQDTDSSKMENSSQSKAYSEMLLCLKKFLRGGEDDVAEDSEPNLPPTDSISGNFDLLEEAIGSNDSNEDDTVSLADEAVEDAMRTPTRSRDLSSGDFELSTEAPGTIVVRKRNEPGNEFTAVNDFMLSAA